MRFRYQVVYGGRGISLFEFLDLLTLRTQRSIAYTNQGGCMKISIQGTSL